MFSITVVHSDGDQAVAHLGEGNIDVAEIFAQCASWPGDGDVSGLDLDGDACWDVQLLF